MKKLELNINRFHVNILVVKVNKDVKFVPNKGYENKRYFHYSGETFSVSSRMIYIDASKPQLVEGFIKNTFTAMIEGVGEKAIQHGITDKATFGKGIKDLYRTAEPNGVFSYTFFKGFGKK